MVLWLLQIPSVVGAVEEDINETLYIEIGAKSVELSCGEVPEASAVEWNMNKSNEWKKILKFYHAKAGKEPAYYNNYTQEKYDIGASVNTSLVIKNIQFSDRCLFICETVGGPVAYSYTIQLEVVGKSLVEAYLHN